VNKQLYEQGQKLRREVLGDEYVDAAAKTTTDFNRPFQELIAEYVWGTLWSRPGLDHRTRALINLGVLTATAAPRRSKSISAAAQNIGVSREDVREVLMQPPFIAESLRRSIASGVAQNFFNEQDAKKST
jgi:4-carboxymuconolactone decarboxylase